MLLLAVIYLYGITAWNKKINISFNNIRFQTDEAEDTWLPEFYFNSTIIDIAQRKQIYMERKSIKGFFF